MVIYGDDIINVFLNVWESPAQAGLPCFLQTAAEERAGTELYLKQGDSGWRAVLHSEIKEFSDINCTKCMKFDDTPKFCLNSEPHVIIIGRYYL